MLIIDLFQKLFYELNFYFDDIKLILKLFNHTIDTIRLATFK